MVENWGQISDFLTLVKLGQGWTKCLECNRDSRDLVPCKNKAQEKNIRPSTNVERPNKQQACVNSGLIYLFLSIWNRATRQRTAYKKLHHSLPEVRTYGDECWDHLSKTDHARNRRRRSNMVGRASALLQPGIILTAASAATSLLCRTVWRKRRVD